MKKRNNRRCTTGRKLSIPSTIKVGGLEYDIEILDDLADFGLVHFSKKKILLARSHIDRMEQTLLHEIIEIINNEYDLELPHRTISVLENLLYQVLKDNKIKFC